MGSVPHTITPCLMLHAMLISGIAAIMLMTTAPPYYRSAKFEDLLRPDSLDEAEVVIPITWADAQVGDTPFVPTSLFAVQNGIGMPMRRKKKDGSMTKNRTSGLALKQHAVGLAFAVTDVCPQLP